MHYFYLFLRVMYTKLPKKWSTISWKKMPCLASSLGQLPMWAYSLLKLGSKSLFALLSLPELQLLHSTQAMLQGLRQSLLSPFLRCSRVAAAFQLPPAPFLQVTLVLPLPHIFNTLSTDRKLGEENCSYYTDTIYHMPVHFPSQITLGRSLLPGSFNTCYRSLC